MQLLLLDMNRFALEFKVVANRYPAYSLALNSRGYNREGVTGAHLGIFEDRGSNRRKGHTKTC